MEQDLLEIINNYGVIKQLKYFQSEVFELNESIIRYEESQAKALAELDCCPEWHDEYVKHITEEIADVAVMLLQFKEYYHIDGKDILETMKYKINRQLERIYSEVNNEKSN